MHQIGSGVAELNAVVVPGDSKLACYKMYAELEALKGLAGGLDGKGKEYMYKFIYLKCKNKIKSKQNVIIINALGSFLFLKGLHGEEQIRKLMKEAF